MIRSVFRGISHKGVYGTRWRDFFKALLTELTNDFVMTGAAALGFYMMLAIFPAMIFLLNLLPYLHVPNLKSQLMQFFNYALPGDAANFFTGALEGIVSERRDGLLSAGALLTLWAASSGMKAMMVQLNLTYELKERRPWWKIRLIAMGLTVAAGALMIAAFGLIVAGDSLQEWLGAHLAWSEPLNIIVTAIRWIAIPAALSLALAFVYYFGPDTNQEFRFISAGTVLGVIMLILATLGFRIYVDNFANYDATYGSLGAMVVLMLWFYISGIVILLGSEVNALIEHYSPDGKTKGSSARPTSG